MIYILVSKFMWFNCGGVEFVSNFEELTAILDKFSNGEDLIDKFKSIVDQYIDINSKEIKNILEKAVLIFREKENKDGEAWIKGMIGWYYHYDGDYAMQLKSQIEAESLFLQVNDKKGLAYIYNGMMTAYFQIGYYELSIKYGRNALKLAEEIQDEKYIIIIIINMCVNYIKNNKYTEAQKTIDIIKDIPINESSFNVKITINQIIAEVECELGDIEKALISVNEAIKLSCENNLKIMLIESIRIRSRISIKKKEFSGAEEALKQCVEMTEEEGYKEEKAWTLLTYAELYYDTNQWDLAIQKLNEALNISQRKNMVIITKNIYDGLYKAYKGKEDYRQSLNYYEKLMEIEKSLSKSEFNAQILENEAGRQTDFIFKSLYDEIKVISNIGQKITADLNINRALENIYSEISMLMSVDILGVTQLTEDEKTLEYTFYLEEGKRICNIEKSDLTLKESIGAYCIKNKSNLIIDDIYAEYTKFLAGDKLEYVFPKVHSMIYCPLILEDRVKGFLTIQSYKKSSYTIQDLNKVAVLASYVAIAIENSYLYNKTKYYASHDYLTGLLSRKELYNQGEKLYKDHIKLYNSVTFMMIDIDNFKLVNDNYGHLIGDEVIKNIGRIIKDVIGEYGVSGRYGGEEFLIVLPAISQKRVYILSEKIRKTIEELEIKFNGKKIGITGSIGIFTSTGLEKGFDQCVSFADEALYIAKAEGKNKIVKYENF